MSYTTARHRILSLTAEDEIIKQVYDGYSPIDIAKAIGMSVSGLYRMLSRRNVPPQTARGRKPKTSTIPNALFHDYYFRENSGANAPEWTKIINQTQGEAITPQHHKTV